MYLLEEAVYFGLTDTAATCESSSLTIFICFGDISNCCGISMALANVSSPAVQEFFRYSFFSNPDYNGRPSV